jgi:hypothetical protein
MRETKVRRLSPEEGTSFPRQTDIMLSTISFPRLGRGVVEGFLSGTSFIGS